MKVGDASGEKVILYLKILQGITPVVCAVCLTGNPVLFGSSFDKHDRILAEMHLQKKKKVNFYVFSGTTKPFENLIALKISSL